MEELTFVYLSMVDTLWNVSSSRIFHFVVPEAFSDAYKVWGLSSQDTIP